MQGEKSPQTKQAERKLGEILGAIHYDTSSLTHQLVKSFRNGGSKEAGQRARDLLVRAADEMMAAYQSAIAQPENNVASRPVVDL